MILLRQLVADHIILSVSHTYVPSNILFHKICIAYTRAAVILLFYMSCKHWDSYFRTVIKNPLAILSKTFWHNRRWPHVSWTTKKTFKPTVDGKIILADVLSAPDIAIRNLWNYVYCAFQDILQAHLSHKLTLRASINLGKWLEKIHMYVMAPVGPEQKFFS